MCWRANRRAIQKNYFGGLTAPEGSQGIPHEYFFNFVIARRDQVRWTDNRKAKKIVSLRGIPLIQSFWAIPTRPPVVGSDPSNFFLNLHLITSPTRIVLLFSVRKLKIPTFWEIPTRPPAVGSDPSKFFFEFAFDYLSKAQSFVFFC